MNEANDELLEVEAKEVVVLEAEKIVPLVESEEEDTDAIYIFCVNECPVEEDRDI